MKISTNLYFTTLNRRLSEQQNKITNLQTQLASGKKAPTASMNSQAAMSSLRMSSVIQEQQDHKTGLQKANGRLQQEEGLVAAMRRISDRIHELSITAANDTYSAEDRKLIAIEVAQFKEQLLSYANEKDEDGNYFFSGTATATKPFINTKIVDFGALTANQTLTIAGITITAGGSGATAAQVAAAFDSLAKGASGDSSGGNIASASGTLTGYTTGAITNTDQVTFTPTTGTSGSLTVSGTGASATTIASGTTVSYVGDQTAIRIDVGNGEKIRVNTTGTEILSNITRTAANGDVTYVTAFEMLDEFETALNNNNQANIAKAMSDAENFSEKLSKKQVELGLSQNRISNRLDIIDEKTILYKDLMSKSVDTDYTEAITKLSANMLALEAAQSTFAKVSQLSLFNYM